MTSNADITIVDFPPGEREGLEGILEESFQGWYLRHAKRTLNNIETVKVAISSGRPVGLIMLKDLGVNAGYVFYIAVAKDRRQKGIAGLLLDESLRHFGQQGMVGVYASMEGENHASRHLFESRRFRMVGFGDVCRIYGYVRAIMLYRAMVVVPGEILMYKELEKAPPSMLQAR